MTDGERAPQLKELMAERILVLDGAMGTALDEVGLSPADYGEPLYEGCPEILVVTRPDVLLDIHRAYLRAGADIIETDTFGGTPVVLAEYELQDRCRELNHKAAELAIQACREFSTSDRPRFAAGSIGPTTKAISVTGGITFDGLRENFREQSVGLLEGGVDLLLVETQQDTRNAKAALLGIEEAFQITGRRVPVMASCTIEPTGTMLAGQTAEAFTASMARFDLLSVGLNCATGPEFMTDSVRSMAEFAQIAVSCHPNAGLPDVDGNYSEGPARMAEVLGRFAEAGWLNFVGGCCGTTAPHIEALAEMAAAYRPRIAPTHHRALYSGIDLVESTEDNRPLLVGERTNVIGSRKFKKLIAAGGYEEASEIARAQAKAGAQILDICLADPDRDERADMEAFLEQVIRKVKLPLMIDSTDDEVFELALPYCQGKSILNSVNLEDGEERFAKVAGMARRYGAALVVGCIDEDPEQGMAVTRQRKLEVARRSYELLVEKFGIRPEDIIFDPLTFPCGTGDENYLGSAEETIEGIRLIKEALPETRTILGVSNVSFGLPPAGREVLNAVFLYHCTKAGLDLAIVNTQRLERFASIPEEEIQLAEDLLWNRGEDPLGAFADHYRGAKSRSHTPTADLPLDERLRQYIIEGTKDGLVADLERKRAESAPLEIVNGPLMEGMAEVGRLFNDNQLIVAEVLQSAEAMKAAVAHLEQYMEKGEASHRGRILLATVKGDVHDIGKNLVDIILTNNGFDVVNLGIKVPPETLIRAVKEHTPDAIGLSGLLVKSAQQMVVTAQDLRSSGVSLPLIVGGAALSSAFTRDRISPAYEAPTIYAKDAMGGLALIQRMLGEEGAEAVVEEQAREHEERSAIREAARANTQVAGAGGGATAGDKAVAGASSAPGDGAALGPGVAPGPSGARSSKVSLDHPIPPVADLERHVELGVDLEEVWAFLNPQMLYGRHLGLKGNAGKKLVEGDPKALELQKLVERVQSESRDGDMEITAVWRWFEAESEGERLSLFEPGSGSPLVEWTLPRQRKLDGLCLADFVLPPRDGARDHVALFVVGAGGGIRERAEELKEAGEYLRSHGLAALALESAEAAAEWLHARLRTAWGFPDPAEITMLERFQARYRGKRYSFGYPACPDLEGQTQLFEALRPQEIGVSLTEGFMMEPEASVSALVFHHPDAGYFSVGADRS